MFYSCCPMFDTLTCRLDAQVFKSEPKTCGSVSLTQTIPIQSFHFLSIDSFFGDNQKSWADMPYASKWCIHLCAHWFQLLKPIGPPYATCPSSQRWVCLGKPPGGCAERDSRCVSLAKCSLLVSCVQSVHFFRKVWFGMQRTLFCISSMFGTSLPTPKAWTIATSQFQPKNILQA